MLILPELQYMGTPGDVRDTWGQFSEGRLGTFIEIVPGQPVCGRQGRET
ncbi:hypothetical protein MAMMFC1_02470 [Methylomusa anaerophila]|uniref:Uncharacterized protein n=1 Tax=Methylomusa anaerophila TaxID=1930071 RepID=A0A348AL37_9FIRM|nr:hypothetical protein MAMMFC1_02470 [Methylomusa anaerophila]